MGSESVYALTNGTIYTAQAVLTGHALLIEGDGAGSGEAIFGEAIAHEKSPRRILQLLPIAELASEIPQIDLKGANVAPGFIDLQLNGCGGVMFNDTITAETLDVMHQTNLRSGTTSFLPTLITTSDEKMQAAIALVQHYRQNHPHRVLGLHLEGPYLNPKRRGIHDAQYVRPPHWSMIQHIAAAGRETVRLVTLAPEQVEAAMIQHLAAAGIVVAAGHSDATFEQAQAGFNHGVRMATHLFNAMSPWLGRSPGLVGAVLSDATVYAGIIADGHHVHFDSIALVHRLKQDKLILVTDATPPVGTSMESFEIGGQQVFYRQGQCVSAEGTLGGSALTMMAAIAHCVQSVHLPLAEALRMASTYPAQLLGLDGELGKIAPEFLANLVIFDHQLQAVGVVDNGRVMFW